MKKGKKEKGSTSSRIPEPCGNSVDGQENLFQNLLLGFLRPVRRPEFSKKIHLDEAEGVDIGIAQPNRFLNDGNMVQNLLLPGDLEDQFPGSPVFFLDRPEDPFPFLRIAGQGSVL